MGQTSRVWLSHHAIFLSRKDALARKKACFSCSYDVVVEFFRRVIDLEVGAGKGQGVTLREGLNEGEGASKVVETSWERDLWDH